VRFAIAVTIPIIANVQFDNSHCIHNFHNKSGHWRAANRVIVPGNAGEAKGPDFWCAFEDGEVKGPASDSANQFV
jgi:hypothetical protein